MKRFAGQQVLGTYVLPSGQDYVASIPVMGWDRSLAVILVLKWLIADLLMTKTQDNGYFDHVSPTVNVICINVNANCHSHKWLLPCFFHDSSRVVPMNCLRATHANDFHHRGWVHTHFLLTLEFGRKGSSIIMMVMPNLGLLALVASRQQGRRLDPQFSQSKPEVWVVT